MVRPAARGLRDRTPRGRSSGRASANSIERTGVQSPRPGTVRPALWTDVQRRHESRATVRSLHEAFRGAAASGRRRDEGRVDPGGFGVRVRPPSSARTLDATPSGSAAAGLLWRDRRRDGSRHAAAVASVHARPRSGFMDRTVDPCVDFYAFSCGGWQDQNPIPADQAGWSVYGKLPGREPALPLGAARDRGRPAPGAQPPSTQKIGDYFAACMDEAAIEKAGPKPLKPTLAAHRRAEGPAELRGPARPSCTCRQHGRAALRLRLAAGPQERVAGHRLRRGRGARACPDRATT